MKARASVTLHRKSEDGKNAMVVVFSPSMAAISANEKGAAKSYPTILASLRDGASLVTSGITWSVVSVNNIKATISTSGYITLSGMSALYTSASVKIRATYSGGKYNGTLQVVKVKDGSNAVLVSANPESFTIPCTSDGTPKVTSVTSVLSVTSNGEDVTSSYSFSPGGSSGVTSVLSGSTLTLSDFTDDTGYAEACVELSGTTITKQVPYTKVKDGGSHSYQLYCPTVTVYITTAGVMKSSAQTYQAQLLVDGVAQTSGVTWSTSSNYGISASVSSSGLVTITNYEASDQWYFKLTAAMSGIPTQTITVPVGVVSDGEQALRGVAGDTMLYKGEWKEGQTYKKHYELEAGSDVYFTDYVSCGSENDMAVYYICKNNSSSSSASTKPGTNSNYWTKFVTAEALATRLLVSNQILGNIIEAVNLTSRNFWTETLSAKTIDADNATFKNLIVDGYLRSSFQEVNLNYNDTALGTDEGNLFVKDQLNILVAKGSGDTGLDNLSIYLPNNEDYIGARVLIYVSPNITDYGTGQYQKKSLYANIASCFYWNNNVPTYFETDEAQFSWFLNTHTALSDSDKQKEAAGGTVIYNSATNIKVWGGFIELIGTRYTIQSGTWAGDWCRWMVLNVQSADDVEYL